MFPEQSGAYIASRNEDLYLVKVKGVYPTLQLGKSVFDLGAFLRSNRIQQASTDTLDNMELMHQNWRFVPLIGKNSVFSDNNLGFIPNAEDLYLSNEDYFSIRGLYYRLIQQGVPSTKIVRALSYEFKIPTEKIIQLINKFDKQYVDL